MIKYFWITVDIINALGGFYRKYCSKNKQITNVFKIKSISVNKDKDNISKGKDSIS